MIKKLKNLYIALFILFAHSLGAVIDRTITTITVGPTPSGIAITPDGSFAYVANNNNNGAPGQDSVSVINLRTNKVVTTIYDASFNQAYLIAINSKGSKVYVTNSNSSTVTVIDVATNTVEAVIGGFDGPSGIVITPDDTTAYVTNYGGPAPGVGSGNGTTVRVVNLISNTIVGPAITVDLAPANLTITPNGKLVYVINYVTGNPGTGTISIISTESNTVIKTLDVGLSGPYDIVIDSAGKYAYISNFGSNNFFPYGRTVMVLDLSTNKIVDTIKVGIQPSGIAIAPNGRFLYVTNYFSLYDGIGFNNLAFGIGTVSVIDIVTRKVVGQPLLVGASPAWIAITPDGTRAYVVNYTSNTVTVLDINDQMWLYKKNH